MKNAERWRRWLPIVVLCVAVAALFHRLLLGEVIFWGTPLLQFYPWRDAAFDALRAGRLPLWNPLVGHGAPLLANYQTAVFYPPNWLYLIMPTEYAMGAVGALHLVWSGLGMMAFLRRLGADRLGQGVAGLAFALTTWIIARFGFLTITSAYAWLGWLFWAVEGVILRPAVGDVRHQQRAMQLGLLALITGMLLLTGHAQTSFYALLLAGAYTTYRAFTLFKVEGWTRGAASLGLALAAVILGAALAAVQLLPTFELMQTSQRAAGVDYRAALSYSFWPWQALTVVAPGMFGSPVNGTYWGYGAFWEDAAYVGLLTLTLAVRSVRVRLNGEQSSGGQVVPFFAIILLPVIVLALGWNTPVFVWLFENIPTFNLFNAPTRWMVLAVFSVCVLGGVGATGWRTAERGVFWARLAVAGGVSLLLTSLLGGMFLGDIITSTFFRATARLGVVMMATSGLVVLRADLERRSEDTWVKRWRPGWQGLVLVVLATDLVAAGWALNPTTSPVIYHRESDLVDIMSPGGRLLYLPDDEYTAKFDIFLSFEDYYPDDEARWQRLRDVMLPNTNMIDGVPSASNFDPLQVGHHTALLEQIDALPRLEQYDAAARLNVNRIVIPDPETATIETLPLKDPWPRASVASCISGEGGMLCEPLSEGEADIEQHEPESVMVSVSAPYDAHLLLLDTDYPGWQAHIDGEPVPIQRANGAFRAVRVPAGEHTVAFTYRPTTVRNGGLISGVALLVIVALITLSVRNRSTSKR